MDSKRWYAIKTFPGYEEKVKDKLIKQIQIEKKEGLIFEVYIPKRKRYIFTRNKLKLKEELLFPGYVFVNMEFNNDTFYFVRGIQYVTGYAGISNMKQTPKPMRNSEYETMVKEVMDVKIDLEINDKINIINHDLYPEEVGIVKDIDCEKETLDVFIESKEIVIQIDFTQVEKRK